MLRCFSGTPPDVLPEQVFEVDTEDNDEVRYWFVKSSCVTALSLLYFVGLELNLGKHPCPTGEQSEEWSSADHKAGLVVQGTRQWP